MDDEFFYKKVMKKTLAEWKMFSVNFIFQLTFYHFQKPVLVKMFNV